jgi:hypothetical protein
MNFFAELKRRNVFCAAVLYIGAAWALSQGVAQLLPVFGIDNWGVRWFVIAALIGFPFAMGFSWFYEWTPQGVQRESEVEQKASVTRATGKKLDRWNAPAPHRPRQKPLAVSSRPAFRPIMARCTF